MKRRVLSQICIVMSLLSFQLGYAKEHPEGSGADYSVSAATGTFPLATTTQDDCEKKDQCFVFSYKGYQVSTDGKKVTLTFRIKTNCNRDLSCVAFELPAGCAARATGTTKFRYYTSITNNPFRSIKFENWGRSGCKNGDEDVFSYTITKSDFDKLTTIRVQAKAGYVVGKATFDKDCHTPKCLVSAAAITNIKYTVAGQTYTPTSGTLSSVLEGAIQPGKAVKICFTVPASAGYKTYSLVSYTAPYATFVIAAAHLQKVFDYKTVTVGPEGGDVCLEVKVPNCFFQVDFVKGCIIEKLGPADTNPNNFYGVQDRLIAFATNGTVACVPDETVGNEGCTPGYWKQPQHFGNWAPSVPTGTNATKFFDVFTVCDVAGKNGSYQGIPANLTLLEALHLNGGGFYALARHAAAAYLSATHPEVDYSIKTNDIIIGVVRAFRTGNLYIKTKLEDANEKGCPLKRSEWTTNSSIQAADIAEVQTNQQIKPLTAYPNPANNRTVVQFALNKSESFTVSLYDRHGKQVKQLKTGVSKAGELVQVNVESNGLADGFYLVRLATKSEMQTVKLIFQK